jgi:hypothetical protein
MPRAKTRGPQSHADNLTDNPLTGPLRATPKARRKRGKSPQFCQQRRCARAFGAFEDRIAVMARAGHSRATRSAGSRKISPSMVA